MTPPRIRSQAVTAFATPAGNLITTEVGSLTIDEQCTPEPNSGCVLWLGRIAATGYAMLGNRYVHRVVYEERVGAIPPKWVIDHLCRNRACVNERHLEAVTQRTNIRRGTAPAIVTANTGICARWHDGALMPKGDHRVCRECVLASKRAWRLRNLEKIAEADRAYYRKNAAKIIKRATEYQVEYRRRRKAGL